MTITGGSSLSKDDIERMVKDAEENAAADKARREAAETRNNAEQLAYSVEKLLADNAEQLPDEVKTSVQADVDALKTALAGDDDEALKTAFDTLNASQQKLGEALYQQQAQAAPEGEAGEQPQGEQSSSDDDVVDAEIVDDEDDKNDRK